MNVLALCSGIGGLELGIADAVPEAAVVCYVEREAYAAACLVARMETGELDNAPVWSDLETFDAVEWSGVVDCVAAGFPCQPFSSAGSQGGFEDERDMWPEVERVVRGARPGIVFLENVAALTVSGLARTCADLSALGFDIEWDCIPAASVGASHVRDRVFVLAVHPERIDVRAFREHCAGTDAKRPRLEVEREQRDNDGTERATAKRDDHFWRQNAAPEPTVQRMADGVPNRLDTYRVNRLQAIGNAVVPQAASHAFRFLLERLAHHDGGSYAEKENDTDDHAQQGSQLQAAEYG